MEEVAKIFSIMGIVSGLMPMLGNPVYRQLFNYTIDYFPRSVLVLSSAIAVWNAGWSTFLVTQKSKMTSVNSDMGTANRSRDVNNRTQMCEVQIADSHLEEDK